MIIPSMTYKEMHDNLTIDLPKVEIRKEYYRNRAIKELKKSRQFPTYKIYDYKIPTTNNQYVIYFYAESRFCVEKPIVGSFCILFDENKRLVINYGVRGYKHTPNTPTSMIRQISVYTSHFFHRYNERFLNNSKLSSSEIVSTYLSRNPTSNEIPIKVNEGINRNCQKYGEYGQQAFRVRDGICFTDSRVEGQLSKDGDRDKDIPDSICIIYTTFINKLGLSEDQRIAIDREHVSCINNFLADLHRGFNDEVTTLHIKS